MSNAIETAVCNLHEFYWCSKPDMDSTHERANSVREKFSANDNLEKNFPACKYSNNFRHLPKNLRELLLYKILSKNSLNLFCQLVSLDCVLTSESLKIASTEYKTGRGFSWTVDCIAPPDPSREAITFLSFFFSF